MPGEIHFFEDIYARRDQFGPLREAEARHQAVERLLSIYGRFNQHDDQHRIDALFADPLRREALLGARSYPELFDRFMGLQLEAAGAGKVRWGNNAPRDIFHLDSILRFYPDATIIICVRDVRDFLVSYKNRWRRSSHGERLAQLYHPLTTSMLWRSSMAQLKWVELNVPDPQVRIVRYEDLVRHPEAETRRLCAALGVNFEPAMLDVSRHNSSRDDTRAASGIFTSSAGQWRRGGLTPEEIWLAQLVAGSAMRQAGYPPEPTQANPWTLLGLTLGFPGAVTRALWANRAHRGPTIPYLWRRLSTFVGRLS